MPRLARPVAAGTNARGMHRRPAPDKPHPSSCRRRRLPTALAATPTPPAPQAHLALPADFMTSVDMAALFAWFVARSGAAADGGAGGVRSLHVDVSSAAAWGPTLGVLGVVGRALEHLRIAGDSPQCQMVGCSAPWLALCPHLVSLELDDVVDHSIGDCTAFPTGACRLHWLALFIHLWVVGAR